MWFLKLRVVFWFFLGDIVLRFYLGGVSFLLFFWVIVFS